MWAICGSVGFAVCATATPQISATAAAAAVNFVSMPSSFVEARPRARHTIGWTATAKGSRPKVPPTVPGRLFEPKPGDHRLRQAVAAAAGKRKSPAQHRSDVLGEFA